MEKLTRSPRRRAAADVLKDVDGRNNSGQSSSNDGTS
jgi:hypothetical protein